MDLSLSLKLRSGRRGGAPGPAYDPASLFAKYAAAGVFVDINDPAVELFQDINWTTPVTAVGQLVGSVRDQSGSGWHLAALVDTARPTLQLDDQGKRYLDYSAGKTLRSAGNKSIVLGASMVEAKADVTANALSIFGLYAASNRVVALSASTSFRSSTRISNPTFGNQSCTTALGSVSLDTPYVHQGRISTSGLASSINGAPELITAADLSTLSDTGMRLVAGSFSGAKRFYGGFYIEAEISADDMRMVVDYFKLRIGLIDLEKQAFDVFMCGGQSNCSGQGDYLTSVGVPFGHAAEFQQGGVFKPLKDPTRHYATNTAGNVSQTGSLWPAFAAKYYELTGRRALIIGGGASGLGISGWVSAGCSDVLGDNYLAAKAYLEERGGAIANVSLCFLGGETDAAGSPVKATVKANLLTVIDDIQTRSGLVSMPVYLLSVDRSTNSAQDAGYQTVRDALVEVADENANVHLVMPYQDFVGQGLLSDTVHWNQTALNEAGEIAATNVAALI